MKEVNTILERVPSNVLKVLDKVSSLIEDFYLAGGTALVFRFNHRRSEDMLEVVSVEDVRKNRRLNR